MVPEQNFSETAKSVYEKEKKAVLEDKNIGTDDVDEIIVASDKDVLAVAKRFLRQNKEAYEVLAK